MHQYAPFQVTKIGGLGRDVSHVCQLPHGCLDPLTSMMLVNNPINHGWEEEDGKLLPIWTTLPLAKDLFHRYVK